MMIRRVASLLVIVALAGCGGGSGSGSGASAIGPIIAHIGPQSGPTGLQIAIHVPSSSTTARVRRPNYIDPNTQSIQITVLQGTTTVATVNQNVAGGSSGCVSNSNALTCTASIALNPGSYTVSFISYGGLNEAGTQLAINSGIPATVTAGQANTVNVTLSGVPNAVVMTPASNFSDDPHGIYELIGLGNHAFNVYANDQDDNTIIGPGSPTFTASVTGTLAVTTVNPTAGTPNIFYIVPPSTAQAGTATVTVTAHYASGLTNPCAAPINAPCTQSIFVDMVPMVAIVNSTGGAGTGSVTFYKVGATTPFYTLTGGLNNPQSIASSIYGSLLIGNKGGGALLYTYGSGTSNDIATLGSVTSVASDPSGNLFAGDSTNNQVVEYGLGTTVVSRTITNGVSAPVSMATDANGRLYVLDGGTSQQMTQYDPGGTSPVVTAGGFAAPTGIAVQPGAAPEIYVADPTGGALFRYPYNTAISDGDEGAGSGAPNPTVVVADANTVYSANTANIVTYPSTGTWPVGANSTYATGFVGPITALALDSSSNLYAADAGNSTVQYFPAGTTTSTLTIGSAGGVSAPYGVVVIP